TPSELATIAGELSADSIVCRQTSDPFDLSSASSWFVLVNRKTWSPSVAGAAISSASRGVRQICLPLIVLSVCNSFAPAAYRPLSDTIGAHELASSTDHST